jgi:hypothetical protein
MATRRPYVEPLVVDVTPSSSLIAWYDELPDRVVIGIGHVTSGAAGERFGESPLLIFLPVADAPEWATGLYEAAMTAYRRECADHPDYLPGVPTPADMDGFLPRPWRHAGPLPGVVAPPAEADPGTGARQYWRRSTLRRWRPGPGPILGRRRSGSVSSSSPRR